MYMLLMDKHFNYFSFKVIFFNILKTKRKAAYCSPCAALINALCSQNTRQPFSQLIAISFVGYLLTLASKTCT